MPLGDDLRLINPRSQAALMMRELINRDATVAER